MLKPTVSTVLAALLAPALLSAQAPHVTRAVSLITEEDFAWRIGVIAHDSMQGRDTPSPGLDKTAAWIASEFQRFGLRGGAEGGAFIQRYPLVESAVDLEASSLRVEGGATLRFGAEVLPARVGAAAEVSGGLVVVSGELDGAGLQRAGVQGKHVAVMLPAGAAANRRGLFSVMSAAGGAGAASLILVNADGEESWNGAAAAALRPSVSWPAAAARAGAVGGLAMVQLRASAFEAILRDAGVEPSVLHASGAMRVTPVPGVTLHLTQKVRTGQVSAPNVVGILEGSDPVLRDEYVVFSAHMDHVGFGTPDAQGDSIYNGADDNGSGTVAIMQVAKAMAAMDPAPRRSVIFVAVSGEEKGLWGSQYYAEHPSVPVGAMVANVNADMVGRNWTDTIVAIGKEHSDLGETLNRVNRRHPELGMEAIDDIWPEERFYFRSDHVNFARKGVPVLFFFNGPHEDYHGLDDEPDRIDAEKASRIARLMFYLGVEVADADERPKWNPESYRQIVTGGP